MDRKPTISDLLALRDGEPVDPGAASLDSDPAALDTLAELERIKAELNALPPVSPDPAVWKAIEERAGSRRRPWLQRFPLATAATVFLATAIGIMVWNPTAPPGGDGTGPQVSDPVAQLMLRSQRLESELLTRASAPAIGGTTSEQALLYGIADVDAQLNELYESEQADPAERERLWRQRVTLLESLADVQRGQAVVRPAIY